MENIFIIFGATGDLTNKKIMPALYNLEVESLLPKAFIIVAIGRRDYQQQEYLNIINKAILEHSRFQFKNDIWEKLKSRISYYKFDFLKENYCKLQEHLKTIDEHYNIKLNRIYYLAVAPKYFGTIVDNLNKDCLPTNINHRLMIEKPFGSSLASAKVLNKQITNVFKEENIYRIDHYLGKEMLQSILVLRFANTIFEPLLNNQYVEQIQILSAETNGIKHRGDYYDKSGEIHDMLQSHLLQLISLITMEKPQNFNDNDIRNEKVKIINNFKRPISAENIVLGQYGGSEDILSYRNEAKVNPSSQTETFIALKLFIENKRWSGVPIYIRSGKRLPVKSTEIIIEFKNNLYQKNHHIKANILVIKIQPEEGIFLRFNTKEIGTHNNIIPVNMDFCQNCEIGFNSPEAYEKLIFDALRGVSTLFTRWDEVEAAWEFIDNLYLQKQNIKPIIYKPGTWGPKESDELIEKDHKTWMVYQGENYENI